MSVWPVDLLCLKPGWILTKIPVRYISTELEIVMQVMSVQMNVC